MSEYALTKRAEADLFDIFLFGHEQFGARRVGSRARGRRRCNGYGVRAKPTISITAGGGLRPSAVLMEMPMVWPA
jgi:hypothetical protein